MHTLSGRVRVFTHLLIFHKEVALNYKFKHKRANKSLSGAGRVDQWFITEYHIYQFAIKVDCLVGTHKSSNVFLHFRR